MRVGWPIVRTSTRFNVSIELDAVNIVGEIAAVVAVETDPANVVLGSIRVANSFPSSNGCLRRSPEDLPHARSRL